MERLICNRCGEKFTEDEAGEENVSFSVPYGNGYVMKEEYKKVCPYCGSDDIDTYFGYDEEDEDDELRDIDD